MPNKYTSLGEFRDELRSFARLDRAEDARNSTDLRRMLRKVLESEFQLDAILLLVDNLSHLHCQPEIWKFYQEIIEMSRERAQCPYVIAMSAAHNENCNQTIVKFNITRLVYQCTAELLTHNFIGNSNVRIGCAQVLIMVKQYKDAAWVLRELRSLLSLDDEMEKEFSYVANNKEILEELISEAPTNKLRMLARHILETSGLWDDNPRPRQSVQET